MNVETLTSEQRDQYVKDGGVACPFCGETNIEGGPFDCEGATVWQHVYCTECEGEWDDIYTLTSIENPI